MAFKRRQRAVLEQAGLSYSEWTGLHISAQGGARAREVAESIGLTSAGITDLVDRLEARRLVRRAPDPDDRRAIRIELTEAGRRLHTETRRTSLLAFARILGSLSAGEYAALVKGLRAFARVEAAADDRPTAGN
ncbi:MAG TPA: MarR family transcriptional regulator [Thermoplasmata archaeon]|nr:MarR family transcriptional regulator [Thermoplasmata archaeon]